MNENAISVKGERKLTKGELIVMMAKEELKNFIANQIPLIYKAFGWAEPDFSEGEDYIIPTGDLVNTIHVNVEVDGCYEDVEIAEIYLTLDGSIFMASEGGDELEFNADELGVDELAKAATSLERTYLKKVTEL